MSETQLQIPLPHPGVLPLSKTSHSGTLLMQEPLYWPAAPAAPTTLACRRASSAAQMQTH